MSKYANIEQIKEVIRTEWVRYMPMELDISLSFVLGKISEVPTIEVSEDCISKATVLEIYSDLYWIDERLLNFKDELDKVYEKLRNAPSAVPQQSRFRC